MRTAAAPQTSKILNGAASQLDRIRNAPAPETVEVDGRSLAQLLAFGARFGALVTFHDLDNQPLGDWSAFFSSDPAIAYALHGSLDLPGIADGLQRLLDDIRQAGDHGEWEHDLLRAAAAIVHLLKILDKAGPSDAEVTSQLTQFARIDRRDSLGEPMKRLHRHLSGRDLRVWLAELDGGRHRDWLHPLLDILEDLVSALIEELRQGAAKALSLAEESLTEPGHAPQAALYNAFAVLFAQARREMNRLPRRLLDFYYGEILRQHSRAPVPDQLFLTFTLAQNTERAAVVKGTLFPAGTDPQGLTINYAADASLEVTPATVSSMSVHRVRFHNGGPHTGDGRQRVATGIVTSKVRAGSGGILPASPFPIFGSDGSGGDGSSAASSLTVQPASIGFAVETATLMLCGGDRAVSISLDLLNQEGGLNQEGSRADAGLAGVIAEAFDFYYSTAGGWMLIDPASLDIAEQPAGTITISFPLPADAPPLVALSTEPADDAIPPTLPPTAFPGVGQLPAVMAQLRSVSGSVPSYYFLLSNMAVASVSVAVQVTDLPPDALSSPSGPLTLGQTFSLFGTLPVQNAALKISAAELFVKQLTSLSVTVDWSGLPVTTTGFLGYYRGYVLNADGCYSAQPLFDNTSFQVTLGVVSPGSWSLPDPPNLYLFQTGAQSSTTAPDAGAPVLPTTVLTAPNLQAGTPPAYYNPSSSALLLTLAEPSYAFGDVLYSSNLTAATDASVATLQARSQRSLVAAVGGASGQIAKAAKVNASATGKSYSQSVGEAVDSAVSALNGDALAALQQAVAQSGADTGSRSDLLQSLQAAVEGDTGKIGGRLRNRKDANGKATASGAVTSRLSAWLADHQGELGQSGGALLQRAQSALAAAGSLDAALASAQDQPVATARPSIAAALQNAQSTAQSQTGGTSTGGTAAPAPAATINVPNPPWPPNATSVAVSYTATGTTVLIRVTQDDTGTSASAASGDGTSTGGTASSATAAASDVSVTGGNQLFHLDLFDRVVPSDADPVVTLLPKIPDRAALYIDLSAPVSSVSLLFVLQAGPGGWSTKKPQVSWQQQVGRQWKPVKVLADTTNDLMNTGIVSLQLLSRPHAREGAKLRVSLLSGMDRIPYVKSVTANALAARWVGPGGATGLGTPLPAGTITQSAQTISGIGTIDQPEDSVGGSPLAIGADFDLWMAERLRHKGFAIDSWDYARLALASVPSLWQLAVIPATDGETGRPAPGQVWVVAVAGPTTPNVSDPTEPMVDPSLLADIGELLKAVASPFVTITVTNPPYVRLTVCANLVFTDMDTTAACEEKLNAELIKWLSPWPDPAQGVRPPDYWSRQAIADFIRSRSYVRAVLSLRTETDMDTALMGWSYLTSAATHRLHGVQDSSTPMEDDGEPTAAETGRSRSHVMSLP